MDRPALQRLLLWRRVQGHLEENRLERREGDKALEPSPLTGILFDASSEPMTPTHAVKKGTRYRYYVSRRLITGPATDSSRGQRVPASNLEALVIGRLRALFADPVQVLNAVADGGYDAPMQKRLRDAAAALSARWEQHPTETLRDLTRALINAPLEHRVGRTAIIRGRRPERPVCAITGRSRTAT